jgi:glycosyltransferase involved in cell wall biosynthesis
LKRAAVFVAGRDPQVELGGGHSAYVRTHALAALRAGFEPHIFCVGRSTGIDQTDYGIVHRNRSPFRPFRALMIPAHSPILVPEVVRFMASQPPPRIIHSFGVWGYVGVRASETLARRGLSSIPILGSYTIHEAEVRSKVVSISRSYPVWERMRLRMELAVVRRVRGFERRAYRGSRLVLCNYESVRRLIEDAYGRGVPVRKMGYAAESAFRESDLESMKEADEVSRLMPRGAPLLVSVSRHDPRKGMDVLLHALTQVKREGIPFRACLVGQGRLLELHRRLTRELGLEDSVALPGLVASAYAYLERADVYCLPSRHEQSGSLALLEALQAGTAIVASACDGIPEDVRDGEDALLVTPGDVVELAAALRRVLTDVSLRERLRRGARETFSRRFSGAAFARDLAALYAEFGMTP